MVIKMIERIIVLYGVWSLLIGLYAMYNKYDLKETVHLILVTGGVVSIMWGVVDVFG